MLTLFVPNFAGMGATINKKLMKDQTFHFGVLDKKSASAFITSINLVSPVLLVLLRPTGRYPLNTDACYTQIGCILPQEKPDRAAKTVGD